VDKENLAQIHNGIIFSLKKRERELLSFVITG
jgi:hypothetical protein